VRRREFILALGGVAAWPLVARAEQAGPMRRVGALMAYAESDLEAQGRLATMVVQLGKHGWAEGRNIWIDARWATDDAEKIKRSARQLVAAQPEVIVSSTTPTTAALLKQTRDIPIVFATVADPIGSGFVVSLPLPGGNATGFINLEGSMAGKWLDLLTEVAPRVKRAAFLYNPATSPFAEIYLGPFRVAAASLAVEPIAVPIHDRSALEPAIAAHGAVPNGGFIVMPGPFMANQSAEIIALAARYRLPAVYPFGYYAELGGLLSCANDQSDNYRRAATYVDRILKGDKPGELPVQAPVKFELTINVKTAKAMGLHVPAGLLQEAGTVIQ
jgi:putative tryptophan/tyrosine transport system substrate-binding protein